MPRKSTPIKLAPDDKESPPEKEISGSPVKEGTPSSSARPRRTARKNVLYSNEDYDLEAVGQPKKESAINEATPPTELLDPSSTISISAVSHQSVLYKTKLEGSRKRKFPPHLAEMMDESAAPIVIKKPPLFDESLFAEGSNLVVGAEYEVPQDDDGPPVLKPSDDFDETQVYHHSGDELDDEAPSLEKNQPAKKRGRPRRIAPVEKKDDANPNEFSPVKIKLNRPSTRILRVPHGEKTSKKAASTNQKNVKLFENELETTPNGDTYAVVINGCLAELLRKERIIDLLTNPEEIEMIRQGGWILEKPPRLPPLTTEKICYAFYVDGCKVTSPKELSNDDLRPWTSTIEQSNSHFLNVKPNVRRHPVARQNGKLVQVKIDPRLAELHLTEYSARLPRELRLRKKIFYLSRENQIFGNVLILYDYTSPGLAPVVMNLPHGNDLLRNALGEDIDDGIEDEEPFEQQIYGGTRGGLFLKLRQSRLGFVQNKKQLLDYLYNKTEILVECNALNNSLPDLPPLIENAGVFVYFVPSQCIVNQIHHATDGLSPWTTNPSGDGLPQARVRSTRRTLYQESNGTMSLGRLPKAASNFYLVETMSTLARCKRIRKRVFYIQEHSGIVHGNVCYIYEFLFDGPLPELYSGAELKQYQAQPKWELQRKKSISDMPDQLLEADPFDPIEIDTIDEEEIISEAAIEPHDSLICPMPDPLEQTHLIELIEPHMEDTLNGGYDDEFVDDLIEKAENPEPFYDEPRALESGQVYLTVRHKKIATSFDVVLEYIVNSNIILDRNLLNHIKPGHPPIVTNARAYAFFVAGSAIFPHDINRDDFSPWSHNGNAENPTCYRTKVRKFGLRCEGGTNFQLHDADYKLSPFHLVYLYSINPKEPRLRKKIYYIMETQSKMVVSHALILYDYNVEGNLPRMNGGQMKTFQKRTLRNGQPQHHDMYNDVSEVSEEEKECPFHMPFDQMPDGTLYMQLKDNEFWNDRNRMLEFLINRPQLLDAIGCLNSKVPELPPPCNGKATFVFFINGDEVTLRSLTADKLAPWSENVCSNPHGVTKRPKSSKVPLGFNRDNQLRVWKSTAIVNEPVEYVLHIYTATLPRCTRLRKKVVYVQKEGRPCGHCLIMYSYTEPGEIPEPVRKSTLQDFIDHLDPVIRNYINDLFKTVEIPEVSKIIYQDHGMHINTNILQILHQQFLRNYKSLGGDGILETETAANEWTNADGAGPSSSALKEVDGHKTQMVALSGDMITEEEMIVEHTEIVQPLNDSFGANGPRENPFLNKSMMTSGFVRGSQRYDALWRIAQKHFGTSNLQDTFDALFKLLHEKNEERLLQSVNHAFNVEIYTAENNIEQVLVEEVVEPGPIADENLEQAEQVEEIEQQ
uniref:DUF7747 domain-containing protein n=1 Tax=Caenorhabditis japonica TaxID=281687 RepID=A0A8R1DUY8_CAEJA